MTGPGKARQPRSRVGVQGLGPRACTPTPSADEDQRRRRELTQAALLLEDAARTATDEATKAAMAKTAGMLRSAM
ncbi:hypothetical protein OHA37_05085 [Streptomyces sp. NBC_00335]|uniref:hypothetical protein n=1 Tax=unclassified Streptomyces TaxID=2593676 RepID=UPI002257DFA5|nr:MULTISPECIES: hypothetical protein [unclassified Streptomyces]MCX5403255.1 hypothetical protein [Streptomyces sp. NBC_00086]